MSPVFSRIIAGPAGLAVVQALRALNAQRIDWVSPYPVDLTQASQAYWMSHGFDIGDVQVVTTPEQGFHAIYLTSTQAATQAAQRLAQSTADAALMLGTGMPTLKTLLAQRGQSRPPMLSSMLALMWQSVVRASSLSLERHGALLRPCGVCFRWQVYQLMLQQAGLRPSTNWRTKNFIGCCLTC